MNILIFDKDGITDRTLGSRVSDLGAVLHHVPHTDALHQTLSRLCQGYGTGCCLVIHDSLEAIVERGS